MPLTTTLPPPEVLAQIIEDARSYVNRACEEDRKRGSLHFHPSIVKFARDLRHTYPFYGRVILYHLVVGGTINFREHNILDFPEPDSIFPFLKQLADLLEQEQKAPS